MSLKSFSVFIYILLGENITVGMRPQGLLTGFYSFAQKIFLPSEERARLYGGKALVTNEADRRDLTSKDMQEALKSMEFTSVTDPTARTMRLSYDGIPFLCYPKNASLCRVAEKDPGISFDALLPGTELIIKLLRTVPSVRQIEQVNITGGLIDDTRYFSAASITTDLTNYVIVIQSVGIEVEIMTIEEESMKKIMHTYTSNILKYRFHVPDIALQRIAAGQQVLDVTFPIERGVELLYVGFGFQSQIYYNTGHKKWCSYRSVVPKSLKKISFHLDGDEIFFNGGLNQVASTEDDSSLSLQAFVEYLQQRGWWDSSHPEQFPRGDVFTYRGIFPLDLTGFTTNLNRDLIVNLQFGGTGSPAHLLVYCIRVCEEELRRQVINGQKRWEVLRHQPKK